MANQKLLDCRGAAALCIANVVNGASLNRQLPLYDSRIKPRDRALFRQLCYGTLRQYFLLDGVAKQLLQKPLKTKDADVHCLLLIGGYQLTDSRVPDHAAINSTVAATKSLNKGWAKSLVNGVLRQWQRRSTELEDNLDAAQSIAHPPWLYQALKSAWPQSAVDIMRQNNTQAPMTLRVNNRQCSRTDYIAALEAADLACTPCEYSEQGIQLKQAVAVEQLPNFSEGWASVQDEAAQLSASLLQLEPGQRVLDACCAPGGKTCHILESEPNLRQVVALDIDAERLQRVEENLQRLQLEATLQTGDAADPESWWDHEPFDRILLDAPCSATGVIRRNPDIKLHRRPSDIDALAQLQYQILLALWSTLKPGGLILYATCSVLPQENEEVIAKFCEEQNDAMHLPIDTHWGISRDFGRQLFPSDNGHDGFFYALIKKMDN